MFIFRKKYFLLTVVLLIVEVLIALFIHDKIIRPYVGDMLVVILIYCFLKTFWNAPVSVVAVSVLLFAYVVETLQYFHFVKLIGLQHSRVATIILGNHFEWMDFVAYTLGILLVISIEKSKQTTIA